MNMKLDAICDALKAQHQASEDLQKAIAYSSPEGNIDRLCELLRFLFEVAAPFKVGDRVLLTRDIEAKLGWSPYAHLLKKGYNGKVTEVSVYKNRWHITFNPEGTDKHFGLYDSDMVKLP